MSKPVASPVPLPVPDSGRKRAARPRPLPRTPVALSVLNLLNERPMHPYEMRVLMRERGHDRAFQIRESSVYDTVARLADRGFIEPVEVSREGRRPERTVYAITEAGRDELMVVAVGADQRAGAGVPGVRRAAHVHLRARPGPGDRRAAPSARRGWRPRSPRPTPSGAAFVAEMPDFPRIFGIEEEYAQAMRRAELGVAARDHR